MNFLILSPFDSDAPRGNSVAACRLMDGLKSRGHSAIITAPDEIAEAEGKIRFRDGFTPDLILVLHAYHCADAVKILKKHSKIPILLSVRGTDANEMLDDREKSVTILSSMRNADKIIVFAEDIRDGIVARTGFPPEKFGIVPNGLEIPSSNTDFRKRLGIPPGAFVFGSLAGLREVKRPLLPLRCLSKIKDRFPQIFFMHAGPALEPKCAAEFLNFASQTDWVIHAGVIWHSETDSFLRATDAYVSASRSEGMPHAVREAMYQGLPCMLSDIPGHRRIAGDSEALFFEGEDDFTEKALIILENCGLREKLAGKAATAMKKRISSADEIGDLLLLADEVLAVRQIP